MSAPWSAFVAVLTHLLAQTAGGNGSSNSWRGFVIVVAAIAVIGGFWLIMRRDQGK